MENFKEVHEYLMTQTEQDLMKKLPVVLDNYLIHEFVLAERTQKYIDHLSIVNKLPNTNKIHLPSRQDYVKAIDKMTKLEKVQELKNVNRIVKSKQSYLDTVQKKVIEKKIINTPVVFRNSP